MSIQIEQRSFLPYHLYCWLAALQGLIVAGWLVLIPTDPKNAVFLGMSANRLLMIAAALFVAALGGALGWKARRNRAWLADLAQKTTSWLRTRRRWGKVLLVSGGFSILGWLILLAIDRESFYVLAPAPQRGGAALVDPYYVDLAFRKVQLYLDRLKPLVVLAMGLSAQTGILVPVICFGWGAIDQKLRTNHLYFLGGVYGAVLIGWGLLGGTHLRLEQDVLGWNPQTSPVTDVHLVLVTLLGAGLLLLAKRSVPALPRPRLSADAIVFVVLWLGAALYWQSIPLESSWFLADPRAPNFEFYPNSDALIYDRTGVSLATGAGFRTYTNPTIIRRPMYTFFLALLHLASDGDYTDLLTLQSMLLAVFPALGYLVTRNLSNRLAGFMVAAFLILREGTALANAETITISHSKLTMSDFPMAVGVALFTFLVFQALGARPRWAMYALLAGGVMGVFILVRMEVSLLLIVTLAIGLLVLYRSRKRWLSTAGLMTVGVILVLVPWLYRNWQKTGQLYLEIPGNRLNFLFTRIRLEPVESQPIQPEEDFPELEEGGFRPVPGSPLAAAVPSPVNGSLFFRYGGMGGTASSQQDPENESLSGRIWNHFLHSNVQMVLTLPTIFRWVDSLAGVTEHASGERLFNACCQTLDYIRRLPYWQWYEWKGELPVESIPGLAITLLFISLGIGKAWLSRTWMGLLPLLFTQAYALILALARTSGARYLLPVDWIFVMYYGIGLAFVLELGVRLVRQTPSDSWFTGGFTENIQAPDKLPGPVSRPLVAAGMGIFLIGVLLPASERVIPENYTARTLQANLESIYASNTNPEAEEILHRRMEGDGDVYIGQAHYPRFYEAGINEQGGTSGYLINLPFDRLTFYLIGQPIAGVVLAVETFPAIEIPDGVEVVAAGCQEEDYFDAEVIFFPQTGQALIRKAVSADGSCPLPPIE